MKKTGLLIIGSLLIVAVAYFFYVRHRHAEKGRTSHDGYEKSVMDDRTSLEKFLDSSDVPENQVYGAVIRMSAQKDDMALKVARTLVVNKSAYLREGAAQALGHYDDRDALDPLKTLMTDSSESVRLFALEALSYVVSAERQKLLEGFLADKKKPVTPDERATALASLYRLDPKENYISELVDIAESENSSRIAGLKVLELAPTSPRVIPMLKKVMAKKDVDDRVVAAGIITLSNHDDKWTVQQLPIFMKSSSPFIRRAAIQSLHRTCPANRWSMLSERLGAEADPALIEILLMEAALLERKPAKEFLVKATHAAIPAQLKAMAEKASHDIESQSRRGACE